MANHLLINSGETSMSNIPSDLRYTRSHEWVRDNGDGTATVGISDHAQELLGDLVFVETPEIGANLDAGDACAVVESVKAASDVYMPLAGEIIETNASLADEPELVNNDAFGEGWIFQIKFDDEDALAELLDSEAYEAVVAEEE
jgi:glycine cleavage system H protein